MSGSEPSSASSSDVESTSGNNNTTHGSHSAHKSTNVKKLADSAGPVAKKLANKLKGESKDTSHNPNVVNNPSEDHVNAPTTNLEEKEKEKEKKPIINKELAATAAPIAKKYGKKIAKKAKKQAGGGGADSSDEEDDGCCCF